MSDHEPADGQDLIDWAVETGRLAERSRASFARQLADGRISASTLKNLAVGLRPDQRVTVTRSGPLNVAATAAPPTGRSAFDRNPVMAAAQMRDPLAFAAASAKAPAPTLFAGGDLPPFTASGIDPKVLLEVPWTARHAIAAAGTTQEAYDLVQRYSEPTGETEAAMQYANSPANLDYRQRAERWLAGGMTDDEILAAVGLDWIE